MMNALFLYTTSVIHDLEIKRRCWESRHRDGSEALLELSLDILNNERQSTLRRCDRCFCESILDIVSKKMKNSKETSANMQIRVLYQFLLEYKKAKDTPKKEKRTGTRISQVKKTQIKKSQDRIKQNSLESSVYSEKNSPLIPQQKKSIMKTSSFSKRTEEENKSIE